MSNIRLTRVTRSQKQRDLVEAGKESESATGVGQSEAQVEASTGKKNALTNAAGKNQNQNQNSKKRPPSTPNKASEKQKQQKMTLKSERSPPKRGKKAAAPTTVTTPLPVVKEPTQKKSATQRKKPAAISKGTDSGEKSQGRPHLAPTIDVDGDGSDLTDIDESDAMVVDANGPPDSELSELSGTESVASDNASELVESEDERLKVLAKNPKALKKVFSSEMAAFTSDDEDINMGDVTIRLKDVPTHSRNHPRRATTPITVVDSEDDDLAVPLKGQQISPKASKSRSRSVSTTSMASTKSTKRVHVVKDARGSKLPPAIKSEPLPVPVDVKPNLKGKKKSKQQEKHDRESATWSEGSADSTVSVTVTKTLDVQKKSSKATTVKVEYNSDSVVPPAKSRNSTSASTDKYWPAETHLVHPAPGGVMNLTSQPAILQEFIQVSIHNVLGDTAFSDSFLNTEARMASTNTILIACAKHHGLTTVAMRLKKDLKYAHDVGTIPDARISSLRNNLKRSCDNQVPAFYGFATLTTAQAKDLLKLRDYIFPLKPSGVIDNSKPYQHPAIISILSQFLFSGSKPLSVKYKDWLIPDKKGRIPIPEATLALVATGIHSVIKGKENGQKYPNFAADIFGETYRWHIDFMKSLEARSPAGFPLILVQIYDMAKNFGKVPAEEQSNHSDALKQIDFAAMDAAAAYA